MLRCSSVTSGSERWDTLLLLQRSKMLRNAKSVSGLLLAFPGALEHTAVGGSSPGGGTYSPMARGGGGDKADRAEYNESQELENLQRVFQILSHQKTGTLSEKDQPKVSPEKLAEALKKLNYKCKRTDVEDMIWEVDEDCDGLISWDEFKAMFYRVRHDKTGWEPRRLFNVVEFMMHDKVRRARHPHTTASRTQGNSVG